MQLVVYPLSSSIAFWTVFYLLLLLIEFYVVFDTCIFLLLCVIYINIMWTICSIVMKR